MFTFLAKHFLPKSGCEVQGEKDRASCSPNVANALAGILYEVFVDVAVGIEGSEGLNKSKRSFLLFVSKDLVTA